MKLGIGERISAALQKMVNIAYYIFLPKQILFWYAKIDSEFTFFYPEKDIKYMIFCRVSIIMGILVYMNRDKCYNFVAIKVIS